MSACLAPSCPCARVCGVSVHVHACTCPSAGQKPAPRPGLPGHQDNFSRRPRLHLFRATGHCLGPRRLSGTTRWQRLHLPAEPGSRQGLRAKPGSLFQSLLSCDPPRALSSLFCFLFCSERRGGSGIWGLRLRCGLSSPLPDVQVQRASVSAQSMAQWHHRKGILMSLPSSLAPDANRLFPTPWCQSNTASPTLTDTLPPPPRPASSETHF